MQNITQNMLQMYQGSIGKALKPKRQRRHLPSFRKSNKSNKLKRFNRNNKISRNLIQRKRWSFWNARLYKYTITKESKTSIWVHKLHTNCGKYEKRLKQNANYDMSIDNMLFNICEEIAWKLEF